MAMQPSVLILDEPTGQLDPIAASDFLATVGRVNRELGTTIIMTEHRLEDAFSLVLAFWLWTKIISSAMGSRVRLAKS